MNTTRIKHFLSVLLIVCINLSLIVNAKQIEKTSIQTKLAALEAASQGRLGIFALNTANNKKVQYRSEESFPFCSTGKILVVAAILKKSQKDSVLMQKKIKYSQQEIEQSGYAPITKQNIDKGMNVAELCKAALDYSDNAAMNILLKILGGPKEVTSYARSIHDNHFQLDRFEPELNTAIPGDKRDTTTPQSMAKTLEQVSLGTALATAQKTQLQLWLKNNTTGDNKIRAGVAKGCIVGDKTGSGQYGTTNDIAIIWPKNSSPIVIAIFLTQNKKDAVRRDDIIAAATRLVLSEISGIS